MARLTGAVSTQDRKIQSLDVFGRFEPPGKAEFTRHPCCYLFCMLSRIQRLEMNTLDMLIVATVLGLVAALLVAVPIG